MQRHRYGPGYGISTESLSFAEVQVSVNKDEDELVTTLLSMEMRVCSEPMGLCLQIQHWALPSSTRRNIMLSKTKFGIICDHITTRCPEISDFLSLIWRIAAQDPLVECVRMSLNVATATRATKWRSRRLVKKDWRWLSLHGLI